MSVKYRDFIVKKKPVLLGEIKPFLSLCAITVAKWSQLTISIIMEHPIMKQKFLFEMSYLMNAKQKCQTLVTRDS